ncbi:ATP synthase F1 subunit delta [Myroides sp. LJL116]
MISTRAAARYAKAMLEISVENGNADAINNDMILISESVSQSNELKTFLNNPVIGDSVKFNAVEEVFAGASQGTKELFKLLKTNSRFELLAAIAADYQKQYEEHKGIERVTVTTAIPMDADLEAKVLVKAKEIVQGKEVIISNVVDSSIIGGFILKIGDKQYNASIAHQLEVLKRELTN